jgi:hypothetical protein
VNRRKTFIFSLTRSGSAKTKKGKQSDCVGQQYIGSIGKNENGQVAVTAALSAGDFIVLWRWSFSCLRIGRMTFSEEKIAAHNQE